MLDKPSLGIELVESDTRLEDIEMREAWVLDGFDDEIFGQRDIGSIRPTYPGGACGDRDTERIDGLLDDTTGSRASAHPLRGRG